METVTKTVLLMYYFPIPQKLLLNNPQGTIAWYTCSQEVDILSCLTFKAMLKPRIQKFWTYLADVFDQHLIKKKKTVYNKKIIKN